MTYVYYLLKPNKTARAGLRLLCISRNDV